MGQLLQQRVKLKVFPSYALARDRWRTERERRFALEKSEAKSPGVPIMTGGRVDSHEAPSFPRKRTMRAQLSVPLTAPATPI